MKLRSVGVKTGPDARKKGGPHVERRRETVSVGPGSSLVLTPAIIAAAPPQRPFTKQEAETEGEEEKKQQKNTTGRLFELPSLISPNS